MIKVSVIVPVYNGASYIDDCMKCLLAQTLKDIEIIAVNDASTDDSKKLLLKWQLMYPDRIRVINNEVNKGAGGARNAGIDIAKGEYIGFVDCDDNVDATMYEQLYQKALQDNCDIVDCAYYEESTGTTVLSFDDSAVGVLDSDKKARLIAGMGYSVTKLFRTSLLRTNGCRIREGVIYEDADFIIHAILLAVRAGNIKQVMYIYRNNPQSSSNTGNEQKKYEDMLSAMRAVWTLKKQYIDLKFGNTACNENITEALEYVCISCFACAIGMCLMNQDNPSFKLEDNLKLLKQYTGRYTEGVRDWRSNIYLQANMPKTNIEILEWFERALT